jgi:hypothetical protein
MAQRIQQIAVTGWCIQHTYSNTSTQQTSCKLGDMINGCVCIRDQGNPFQVEISENYGVQNSYLQVCVFSNYL